MVDLPPGNDIIVGGDVDRVTVSVRVSGDALDPDEVTRALGVRPTFAASKGDRRTSGSREVTQRTGVWCVEFGGAPEEWTLDDAIRQLLVRLPSAPTVWDELAAKYKLDVFCGLHLARWNRGFMLPPDVLRQLAERHLHLDVDIYCVESDEAAT